MTEQSKARARLVSEVVKAHQDAPPPAAPDTSARAVVVVIPPGPYAPADYAAAAAAIAAECSNWPTPAPQLAEALRRAVSGWADAQKLTP